MGVLKTDFLLDFQVNNVFKGIVEIYIHFDLWTSSQILILEAIQMIQNSHLKNGGRFAEND